MNAFLLCNVVMNLSYGCYSQEKQSSFEELLEKENSVFIQYINLQPRAIKICQIRKGFPPIVNQELLMPNNENSYNLWHLCQSKMRSIDNVYHGRESILFFKTLDLGTSSR